jgi:hypothetical protein
MSDLPSGLSESDNYHTLYRRQFFKTALCKFFLENRCAKGDFCEHAHTENELVAKPVLTKTRMCKQLLRLSYCSLGDECPYAHDAYEVARSNSFYKSKLCEFIKREGGCKVGDSCRYAHSMEELLGPLSSGQVPMVDFDDSPDGGYPLKRGGSALSTNASFTSAYAFEANDLDRFLVYDQIYLD